MADGWHIVASDVAARANNPIRKIVDNLQKPASVKQLIPLSLGDPTVFGNFKAPEVLIRTVEANLRSGKHNGYIHSAGSAEARRAVAKRNSVPGFPLTEEDVIIGSGCSGALDLAITVLLNPGDTLLIPKPAFALYATLCESKAVATRQYKLRPEASWEVDLADLEACIDSSVKAILVNNPSNPCGSVYSEEHLRGILAVAEKHRVPIIADEIYGNLVFPSSGRSFVPLASLTSTVPILSAGGIAKEFLVPGWRVGWVCVHDRQGLFAPIRKGLFALSQLILGANSLILSALPAILTPAPGSADEASLAAFHADTVAQLERNATLTATRLAAIPGISVVVPQGAMYVMFSYDASVFPAFKSDLEFAQALLSEESVFVLPGAAFAMPGYCRIVFCAPYEKLLEAFERMTAFCARHAVGAAATAAAAAAAAAVADGTATAGSASSDAAAAMVKAATAAALVVEGDHGPAAPAS